MRFPKSVTPRIYRGMVTEYGKLFIAIVSIALLSFIVYLFYAGCTLRQSQKKIVSSYEKHIAQADSLVAHHSAYAASNVINFQEVTNRIVVDSLVKTSLGSKAISTTQTHVLIDAISQYFKEQSDFRKEYFVKFKQDSLLLCAERNVVADQTKQMLDLHLGKIEHEYSNITMWTAILTVIFLVFSFYSIFKMDELIKQGDDGLKDIRKIREDGRIAVEKFKTDTTNELTGFKTKTTEAITDQNTIALEASAKLTAKISEMESAHLRSQAYLDEVKLAFENKSEDTIKAFEESLNKLSSSFQSSIESKIDEFNSMVVESSKLIDNIRKQVEEQSKREEDVK